MLAVTERAFETVMPLKKAIYYSSESETVVNRRRRPLEVGMKRTDGVAPVAVTGTPFAKVAVMEVALLITPDVLETPDIMTTTSLPLVGKPVPTMSSVVAEPTVTELITGELAYNCSY